MYCTTSRVPFVESRAPGPKKLALPLETITNKSELKIGEAEGLMEAKALTDKDEVAD